MAAAARSPAFAPAKDIEDASAGSEEHLNPCAATDLQSLRTQACRIPKQVLIVAIFALLGVEFAAVRVTRWTAPRGTVRELEEQIAVLVANVTSLASASEVRDQQLESAQTELANCMARNVGLSSDVAAFETQNADLRANATRLALQHLSDSKELDMRLDQIREMGAVMQRLEDSNTALHANLSETSEQSRLAQDELDLHYKQFLSMRADMEKLRKQNKELRSSLESAGERQWEEDRNQSWLEEESALDTEELDEHYRQYVQLREETKALVETNLALRANLSQLQMQEGPANQGLSTQNNDSVRLQTGVLALNTENVAANLDTSNETAQG